MKKTAIIDIDNTLWQFCNAFLEELRRINREFPPVERWDHARPDPHRPPTTQGGPNISLAL